MSDEKPREFWIYDNGEYFGSMVSTRPIDEEDKKTDFANPDEIYHVIEYPAYKAVKKELDFRNAEVSVYKEENKKLSEQLAVAVEALERTATPSNVVHTVYPECFCPQCKQKQALAKINEEGE